MDEIEKLIDEGRDIGRLICPLPQDVDDGAPIERMPDDLLKACSVISRLCDAIEVREGEETGWVIEHEDSEPSRPMYFTGNQWEWDYDNLKAIRFARREDAQKLCRYMFPGEPHRIADHMWCP